MSILLGRFQSSNLCLYQSRAEQSKSKHISIYPGLSNAILVIVPKFIWTLKMRRIKSYCMLDARHWHYAKCNMYTLHWFMFDACAYTFFDRLFARYSCFDSLKFATSTKCAYRIESNVHLCCEESLSLNTHITNYIFFFGFSRSRFGLFQSDSVQCTYRIEEI